ncbi:MAG: hypothetical protein A2W61_06860 [Deltaproteobacteria bacterium RIFCSPLOWO2_01_44_7]|nr:MAG: hypothetical protein A2712_01120 [Deltaproteobacteria bacterium RIFCSPHIGHO2_01_FULL_43_49]OGQ15262.1 MAG: hypothetical protein A3D22_04355 [Deltaproteobacteria bacterium RIFCSPHIGHO2_02_FULL_44_53]OGQ27114.1 MAG: hypothetical protein A3D98_01710 [Deltaproteobacteria bacterium RIFCSPHIGHO2_12_FULL_44_21]OGQ31778.1 MAG: hypothetical protein A2979_05515 [Deltaproteobacteria bacterium RIFCSPLOWO2_01_FULL_45_74]OGQ42980.1 MAG: hypothetical protein A3I70_07820 [Deltaproteobacteria bacterium 
MNFIRCLAAICHKDLLSELRKRETLNSILFFGILIIFLFSFAIGPETALLKKLAPGLLWLVVLFSAVLALDRSFQAEAEEGCLDRLILYSVSHRAIFLGKLFTNFLFVLIVQTVVLLMMMVLYDLDVPKEPWNLVLIFLLGDLGIATLGTFYALLITKTRARQVMLPLLLFPMLIPLLLACVFATQYALEGDPFLQARPWIEMLFVFDSIFLSACLLTAGLLLEA